MHKYFEKPLRNRDSNDLANEDLRHLQDFRYLIHMPEIHPYVHILDSTWTFPTACQDQKELRNHVMQGFISCSENWNPARSQGFSQNTNQVKVIVSTRNCHLSVSSLPLPRCKPRLGLFVVFITFC